MSLDKLLKINHASGRVETHAKADVTGPVCLKSLGLDGFDYKSNYFETGGYKLHYIDTGEGPYERTAVCLHSRYGWSYSFRKILPVLKAQGFRVIAIDLLGFGFSDKTTDVSELGIAEQSRRVAALVRELDLREVSIISHEMGASISLHLPRFLPGRVDALIFANPAGRLFKDGWPGFHLWRTLVNARGEIDSGREVQMACKCLSPEEQKIYSLPLGHENGTVAIRRFHDCMILRPDDPEYDYVVAGYEWLRTNWDGRMVTIVGAKDPVFGVDAAKRFCGKINCPKGPVVLQDVGAHPFEQDPECIRLVLDKLFAA